MSFFNKLSLIFCGADLVFAVDSFMCTDWIFCSLCAASAFAFLSLGWKGKKKND